MRIVSGHMRGRNIATPSGRNTRPTSDQTRESIFNILAHANWAPPLDGAIVTDIFAGSGALGLEAISRGAEFLPLCRNRAQSARRYSRKHRQDGSFRQDPPAPP